MKSFEEKQELLKSFMLEFFDYDSFREIGLYGKEIKRHDYEKQAERICKFLGLKTIYEYGAKTTRAHLSWDKKHKPKDEPFVREFKSIYE